MMRLPAGPSTDYVPVKDIPEPRPKQNAPFQARCLPAEDWCPESDGGCGLATHDEMNPSIHFFQHQLAFSAQEAQATSPAVSRPADSDAAINSLFSEQTLHINSETDTAANHVAADGSSKFDDAAAEESGMLTRVSAAVAAAAAGDPLLSGPMPAEGPAVVLSPPSPPGIPAGGFPTASEAADAGQCRRTTGSHSQSSAEGDSPKDDFSQRFKAEATKLSQAQAAHPPAKVPVLS